MTEKKLSRIIELANSKVNAGRKSAVQQLSELLENTGDLLHITQNSVNNGGDRITWNDILGAVHNIVMNLKDSSPHSDKTKALKVLLEAVKLAHNNLNTSDIISFILEIFNDSRYLFAQSTYLYALSTYILSIPKYQNNITQQQWKELLKLCQNSYDDDSHYIKKEKFLEALQLITKYGCSLSSLTLTLKTKELIPFLGKIFDDMERNEDIIRSGLKLAIAVCQELAVERHNSLCKLGEILIPKCMNFKHDEKYELFLIFVQSHHPLGATMNNENSCVIDAAIWKTILRNMCTMILQISKTQTLSNICIDLGCEVFRQIIEDPTAAEEVFSQTEIQSSENPKRRRISKENGLLINMITGCSPERALPMLKIFAKLFKKYPTATLQPQEFTLFLQTLSSLLMQSSTLPKVVLTLYELGIALVDVEKNFDSQETWNKNKFLWSEILDTVASYLSTKVNQEAGHQFLQYLIENDRFINLNSLLKMYVTKTMNWSLFGLQTLLIICSHTILPERLIELSTNSSSEITYMTPLETQIVEWVSAVPWKKIRTLDSIKIISQLLIGLMLKSWHKNSISKENVPLDESNFNLTDVEKCYLAMKFRINIFNENKNPTKNNDTEQIKHFHNREYLAAFYTQLENILKPTNKSESVRVIIVKCSLIVRIINDLKEIEVFENDFHDFPLLPLFKENFEKIFKFLSDTDLTKLDHKNTLHMMKVLRILFQATNNCQINQIIIDSTVKNVKALQNLYSHLKSLENVNIPKSQELTSNQDTNFIDKDNQMEQATIEEKKNSIAKTLILYCCIATDEELIDIQENLLESLLNVEGYDLKSSKDIQVLMNILEIISKSESGIHTQVSVEIFKNLLNELFPYLYKNQEIALKLLRWLPNFFKIAVRFEENITGILKLVTKFHEILQNKIREPIKTYGPLMHLEFLKSLRQIIKIDRSLKFLRQNESVVEYLFEYVNSSFFVVRLEAARCVYELFSSVDIDYQWKMYLFEKLKLLLHDSFLVKGDLKNMEKSDELMTRGTSMLYIISAIIYASNFFRLPALFLLVHFAALKSVDSGNVRKILKIMLKEEKENETIVEKNLNYLLISWWNVQKSFDNFPFDVTYCSSEEQFYKVFMHTLLPILIQTGNIDQAKILCEQQEFNFEREFEKSFSKVIAWLLTKVTKNPEVWLRNILRNLETNQREFKAVKRFIDLLHENLDRIIIVLVEELHDEGYFSNVSKLSVKFPETSFTRLVVSDIDECLLYMENNFFLSGKLVHYLGAERRDVLQKVLLQLTKNVYTTNEEFKLKALHQYFYFCDIIAREMKSGQFDEIAPFLIRDICSTLLFQIEEENFTEVICGYLRRFLAMFLPERSGFFKEMFIPCVRILTRCVLRDEKSAVSVLKFLIVEQKNSFVDVIANLEYFPNSPAFEEMRKIHKDLCYNTRIESLETEFIYFLNKNSTDMESLERLGGELSKRREELKEHYKKLETVCSASSILHRLIHKLTKLMESSQAEISQEAAKCLGYLGPGNLSTMILLPEQIQRIENSKRLEMLTYEILLLLSDLINDRNIEIREASAMALYTVLSSYWGRILIKENYLKNFEGIMNSDKLQNLLKYIRPFITKASVSDSSEAVILEICGELRENSWIETATDAYGNWIQNFTCTIADCYQNFFMQSIIPIFKLSVQFCEKLLPLMVNVLIDNTELIDETCAFINRFFHHNFPLGDEENSLTWKSNKGENPECSYKSVQCMLNIVNFIWIQSDRTVNLNFDYLSIAKGAQYCSAYFTSVLYAELWCDSFLNGNRYIGTSTLIDYIIEKDPVRGKILQDIVREANVRIGDPDAIHGCGSMHLLDSASRIRHYVDLKQWDKAMLMQDIELSCGIESKKDMLHILQQTGLYFLLNQFTSSINEDKVNKQHNDYKYECAWRLGDWNLLEQKSSSQTSVNSLIDEKNPSYCQYHYEALKCLNENDKMGVKQAIDNARCCVIKCLRNISLESTKAVYPMLTQLQMLREIEECNNTNSSDYRDRVNEWKHYEYIKNNDFEFVEPLISQRIAICKIEQLHVTDDSLKNVLIDMHLDLVHFAEQRGHFRIATRTLDSLAKQNNLSQEIKNKLCFTEAHLAWSQDNQQIAQFLLRLLMNDPSVLPSLRAQALCTFGNWIGETESGNPQVIIKQYYQESINTFLSIKEPTSNDLINLYKTHAALARFADMQYRQISEYIKSPQFKTLKSLAQLSNSMSDKIDAKDNELRRAINIYQRQSKNDAAELENFENDKNLYLSLALEYYLKTLEQSCDHDFLIFRVVSLWLDNMQHAIFNSILSKYLSKIASYKFVPLIPQLAPHMNIVNDQFTSKINEILRKCAMEHPHHTLPVLLALKNLMGDSEFGKLQVPRETEPMARVKAATKLINHLLKTKIHPIIEEMSQLSHSLVQLAYLQAEKKRPNSSHVIPSNQAICNIKHLNNIAIPTITMSVRKNGNYENIIGIQKYKNTFVNVGGINAPKKVECIGTDGITRIQLVKGQDDMRQDAVMQQVFTVINSLLNANKETKERKLNIRTYKVVPLTQRSGVLEWCENTSPISHILLGADRVSGIHKKYYPQDLTGLECRKKMEAVSCDSNEMKLKAYLECCKQLHPAFHHFFTEMYPSSEVWFERRLTYTRSIATTSIVGYILSVGDRHLQNVLIDHTTAEVIHIDFGIAFEQGKLLSTPETVPFRLTRDIEVPMGISGVEGVMRRSCEKTLKLLQEQREIIVTLLQVLLYDPLFIWSISSTKASKFQNSSTLESSSSNTGALEINKFANRALLKVQQKLQGIEEGVTLSVEGQVERLIQQARDPSNLCLLFHGWQAYL
ncbi:serine-protein kinase ATM-like [Leptopilina heterotoma]|uniref:serine-protein kinase ATM-like n=1 Tax=Leptopilina heterotoma TaxID=63436 RepID=UPI001CA8F759|nr:serine-protein kinase ATM-like [Leptopilina heterotoma]